ncbi:hypothetical protein H0H93_008780 [Arthromyces matolae]|nr:hypothetical protein H0H93_008780 [Arthromyces matolae]
MIVLWATLQLRGARRLAKSTEFKERGWKTTHGFFAQMGGFVLHTAQGEPANVVWPRDLCAMLQSPLIENPRLTEEEIKARSKSDGIAKALAVIQTTYFFVQCIFRVKEGLPLTELEVITFTYTFVNVYLYVVWWNKPQNVDCAFPVYEKTVSNGGRIRTVPSISVAAECNRNFLSNLGLKLRKALNRLILLLKLAITAPFHGFSAWAVEQEDKGVTAMAVPDLYYFGQGHTSTEPLLAFTAIIGAIIGAIHLAVWNVALGYPTFQEKFAWRVSTVALTAIPPLLFIFVSLATFHRGSTPKLLVDISGTLCGPILMLLYIVCRLALLALPLAALRKLPPDMYRSTFADNLPHFS